MLVATFPVGKGNICGGKKQLVVELLGNEIQKNVERSEVDFTEA